MHIGGPEFYAEEECELVLTDLQKTTDSRLLARIQPECHRTKGVKLNNGSLKEMQNRRQAWEETTLPKSPARYRLQQSSTRFYTPLDISDYDFLQKVGFPGEYPYTTGTYASTVYLLTRLWPRGRRKGNLVEQL